MKDKSRKKRNGFVSTLFWIVNILAALALAFSYLSAYINPQTTTFFAFFGLAYYYILLANLLLMLYWLIRGRARALLSLAAILLGYQTLLHHVQFFPGKEKPLNESLIKLLSYNVKNMSNSNAGIEREEIRRGIYGFLQEEAPDIACLQEFSARGDMKAVVEEIKNITAYPHVYCENYNIQRTHRVDAMVIMSKLPIVNRGILSIPGDNHQFGIYADLLHDDDTIRIYNLHMESIRFQTADYRFVEDIGKVITERSTLETGSKSIIKKLQQAFLTRARQTVIAKASLALCPHDAILCGDFNDTPLSYSYRRLAEDMKDAFVESGYGLGNTFAGKLPPLRIDYILFQPAFRSFDFRIHKIPLSDHYPLTVYLGRKTIFQE